MSKPIIPEKKPDVIIKKQRAPQSNRFVQDSSEESDHGEKVAHALPKPAECQATIGVVSYEKPTQSMPAAASFSYAAPRKAQN